MTAAFAIGDEIDTDSIEKYVDYDRKNWILESATIEDIDHKEGIVYLNVVCISDDGLDDGDLYAGPIPLSKLVKAYEDEELDDDDRDDDKDADRFDDIDAKINDNDDEGAEVNASTAYLFYAFCFIVFAVCLYLSITG